MRTHKRSIREIKDFILSNTEKSTMVNIVAPVLSGKRQLALDLHDILSSRPRSLAILIDLSALQIQDIVPELLIQIEQECGDNIEEPDSGINFGDAIYRILVHLSERKMDEVCLIFSSLECIEVDSIYFVLGQLRNLREKLLAEVLSIKLRTICIGCWLPSNLKEQCSLNIGSFFPEELYFVDYDFNSTTDLLKSRGRIMEMNELNQVRFNYLLELSGKCYGIIDWVEKNMTEFNCSCIKEAAYNMAFQEFFSKAICNSLSKLSEHSLGRVIWLLKGNVLNFPGKQNNEELLLSGLVRILDAHGVSTIVLRSWIHEIAIRCNEECRELLDGRLSPGDYKEFIPPTPSLNKLGYQLIMDIENKIRNIIYQKALDVSPDLDEPYKMFDHLPLSQNQSQETLFSKLKQNRTKQINLYSEFIESNSSLNSFMDVQDLINVVSSGFRNCVGDTHDKLFEDSDERKKFFNKFRIIRNHIAHNNITTERTIEELQNLYKLLIIYLSKE